VNINREQKIVVIGAGPAGLTAAIELQRAGFADISVFESDSLVGGISKTVNYKGNRIDIGGHRFFSKSDWVMNWWADFLPVPLDDITKNVNLVYKGMRRDDIPHCVVADSENVMLIRNRLSRIYFNNTFFNYPLKLNAKTLSGLGLTKTLIFGLSYVKSHLFPIKPEKSLEDFLTNRFGRKLFEQFFKEYTEKVWGVPCSEISAEWGAQRIKSLSILSAIVHAIKSSLGSKKEVAAQTSLIEHFLYPKYGPGQMWEVVAKDFVNNGGKLYLQSKVEEITISQKHATQVTVKEQDGAVLHLKCDYLLSTMPIKDLVTASASAWSKNTVNIASNLQYRDFITVGLLYQFDAMKRTLNDNWIYIQEPGVQVGRVQVFNNWSPSMVADSKYVWLGLEYFCKEGDDLWELSDTELSALAQKEMYEIGLVKESIAVDGLVLRVPKAYPGYFGDAYRQFDVIRKEIDSVENLFLIGRNGMHRYNNQDHSMLTAAEAAKQIASGSIDKSAIWNINVDDEYHEESSTK